MTKKGVRIVAENGWYWNKTRPFTSLWCCLRRIRKFLGKKRKDFTEEEMQRCKTYFEGKNAVFIIEKVAIDVIERCKLPKPIDFRKNFGYNHDDILVPQETSTAEKIIKLFPYENIVLNKKFKSWEPNIWFKDLHLTVEVDEGNHEDYDTDAKKEREDTFKRYSFKTIKCNPNVPVFDINRFLGEINYYVKELREQKQWMRWSIKLLKTCSDKIKTIYQKYVTRLQE